MPRLHVSMPDGSEATHELTDEVITIGRVSDNAIQIDDASVSSHHAELTLVGTDYVLKDLGSTNGTRLNGTQITPEEEHRLQLGNNLRFGSIPIRYLSDNEEDQQPLPEESEPVLAAATASVAPTDFTNAAPFPKKKKEKDTAGMAMVAVGIVAILAAGGAIFLALQMPAPPL